MAWTVRRLDNTLAIGVRGASTHNAAYALWWLTRLWSDHGMPCVSAGNGLAGGSASYSDGSFSAIADLTSAAANGILNTNAWACLQMPSGLQILLQATSATQLTLRISVSGFTGGDADTIPTAGDTQSITSSAAFVSNATSYYGAWIDDETGAFFVGGWQSTGVSFGGIVHDPLADGSYPEEDTAPWVVSLAGLANGWDLTWMNDETKFLARATSGGSAVSVEFPRYFGGATYNPSTWTTNDASATYGLVRPFYALTTEFPKGLSSVFRYASTAAGTDLTRYNTADGDSFIQLGDILVRWPESGTAPPSGTGSTTAVDAYEIAASVAEESDVTAPSSALPLPALDSTTVRYNDSVGFTLTDNLDELALCFLWATFADGSTEAVYDGSDFLAGYSSSGAVADGDTGKVFTLRRDGGWPDATVSISWTAADMDGNTASGSYGWTISVVAGESPSPIAVGIGAGGIGLGID